MHITPRTIPHQNPSKSTGKTKEFPKTNAEHQTAKPLSWEELIGRR
jgi:hypothetical protein